MLIRLNNTLFLQGYFLFLNRNMCGCLLARTFSMYFAYRYENNQIVMFKILPDISFLCLKQPNHEQVVLKI